jgi:hypothetical protein
VRYFSAAAVRLTPMSDRRRAGTVTCEAPHVGAIVSSDFPTAQGAIMILAIAFLSINLLVDVLYVYLDPRLQRS